MGPGVRRLRLTAIAIVIVFGVVAAVAAARPVAVNALVTVKSTQNDALGNKILVNAKGRTLYHYSSEKKNAVKCTAACAAKWPPLLIGAGAKPIAAPGVTANLLGTVKRPDGKLQVTYRGFALYLYSGDKKAGDVKGQGNGGIWHAIAAPSGSVVMKAAKTTTGSSTGTSSGSGSHSGSGSSSGSGGTGSTGGGGGGVGTSVDCDANPAANGCGM